MIISWFYIITITSFLKELSSRIVIDNRKNDSNNKMPSESLGVI